MDLALKQKKLLNKSKVFVAKLSKFVISRMLYFVLGIFLVISVYAVKAWEWYDTVPDPPPDTVLSSEMWNDMVAKLAELDARVADIDEVECVVYTAQGPGCEILAGCNWEFPSSLCPDDHPFLQFISVGAGGTKDWYDEEATYTLTCCGRK